MASSLGPTTFTSRSDRDEQPRIGTSGNPLDSPQPPTDPRFTHVDTKELNVKELFVENSPIESPTDSQRSIPRFPAGKRDIDITTVVSAGSDLFSPIESPQAGTTPWIRTFLRFAPLAGICCTLVAVICMLVSLSILLGSRDAPTESWKVQPSAYLAICTAISNQALRFASFQGVIIAWWSRAASGATLRRLHYDWRAGTTVLGALVAGREMGTVGLACVRGLCITPLWDSMMSVLDIDDLYANLKLDLLDFGSFRWTFAAKSYKCSICSNRSSYPFECRDNARSPCSVHWILWQP